jgi:membrane protein YqaA with SNARE-associated domain
MSILATYASLLVVSFLAATILPGSSEVFLATIALSRPTEAIPLLAIATTGNTLRATVNWALGRWFLRFSDRRWFAASDRQQALATNWFNRYGSWSLLLSWLPLVGDPLTLVAGILRVNLYLFLILVVIGKAARYVAVLLGVEVIMGFL